MLLLKYVLDKGCQHKRQYRFYTWNHFLDGWSKAICKAFHTANCVWSDRTVFVVGKPKLFERLLSLLLSLLVLLSHCLCFLNYHLTNAAFHWKKNIFKNFITNCECLSLMSLKKISEISILEYDNGSIRLHPLFL